MILAAGPATRLYPLTYTLPKPMLPVANIPVIEHIISLLARHGFTDIMVNLHYLRRLITDYLGDGSRLGVRIHYSHEDELRGTAGGVGGVADFFDDTFLVIGGDDLTDMDLSRMLEAHRRRKALATVAVTKAEGDEFGVAELDAEQRVVRFEEKPRARPQQCAWVNTGVYFFEPEVLRHIPDVIPYDFGKHLFPDLIAQGLPFYGYPVEDGYWCDVGDYATYRKAHWDVLDGICNVRVPGREVSPHVWIDEGAQVSPQATILPPAVIGRGAKVEAGARLEGRVVLGPETVVESGARLRSSIVWERAQVGPKCEVVESLVGSECILEAGQEYNRVVLGSGARFPQKRISLD